MYVGLFVLPLFIAPFLRQSRFYEQNFALITSGIIISVTGFAFIIMSFTKIGAIPSIKVATRVAHSFLNFAFLIKNRTHLIF
ncbi:MAG: hypothetical protein VR72_12855 [Clostridiaceae bacterium BRH_c20a]|nr:MAG: hypothetical protein VR72_12855 [Clostridiaceae bacterium BRH_c20a]